MHLFDAEAGLPISKKKNACFISLCNEGHDDQFC
jgi:hypothetical protein